MDVHGAILRAVVTGAEDLNGIEMFSERVDVLSNTFNVGVAFG